jgi:hypothetical protein
MLFSADSAEDVKVLGNFTERRNSQFYRVVHYRHTM